MKTSTFYVLRVAHFLFEAVGADPQVAEHLLRKGFSLAWLSQGKETVERAEGLRTRRDGLRSAVKEATDAIRRLFRELETELGDFRFAAWRACVGRPGIALALGVARLRRPEDEPTEGTPAVGPTSGGKRKRKPRGGVVAMLNQSRAMLSAALQSSEALALLEPYGYGREAIEALMTRVDSLVRSELDHERLKASQESASAALHEATEGFRRWFHPWRKRLLTALKDRPDLRRLVEKTV